QHAALTCDMFDSALARTTTRRIPRILVATVLVASTAIIGTVGYQSRARSSSAATSPIAAEPVARRPRNSPASDQGLALGAADGVVPDGVTVFDNEYPAVTNLDPSLLSALRRAATDAAGDGVELYVDSGWRSRKYQEQLLDEAISKYGSRKEAARWVATPD